MQNFVVQWLLVQAEKDWKFQESLEKERQNPECYRARRLEKEKQNPLQ